MNTSFLAESIYFLLFLFFLFVINLIANLFYEETRNIKEIMPQINHPNGSNVWSCSCLDVIKEITSFYCIENDLLKRV